MHAQGLQGKDLTVLKRAAAKVAPVPSKTGEAPQQVALHSGGTSFDFAAGNGGNLYLVATEDGLVHQVPASMILSMLLSSAGHIQSAKHICSISATEDGLVHQAQPNTSLSMLLWSAGHSFRAELHCSSPALWQGLAQARRQQAASQTLACNLSFAAGEESARVACARAEQHELRRSGDAHLQGPPGPCVSRDLVPLLSRALPHGLC